MAEPGLPEPRLDRDRLARGLARLRHTDLHPVESPPPPASPQRWRWWLAGGGVAVLALAGWFVFAPRHVDRPAVAAPVAAAVRPPATGGFILGGYVRAKREIHVGSPVSGVVADMKVSPGSRVKVGQVIAELANETLKAQVAAARAGLAGAQARLAEVRAGALPAEIRSAEAKVAELDAEQVRARQQLQRQQALERDGLVARSDLEQAEEDVEVAAARADGARQDLALLRQGERPERVRQAEADVAQARAALELAEAQVNQTVIRSPIDGVVTQQHAEVGELVSAGFGGGASAALVTVADVAELVVEIDLPHAELPRIHLGDPARVTSEALAGRNYSGHVSWIGPEANRQKLSVPIEVALTGDTEGLLPGLSAKVTLVGKAPRRRAETSPAATAEETATEEGTE
jgi:multidrug efflux pump subunit AcrA (membrane-fusion protein)